MKILASDYDGTFRVDNVVTKENIEAVHAWRKAGNAFGMVSGRSMESIRKEIEEHGIEVDFVVGNNGGVIYSKEFEELKSYYIPFEKAKEIISYLRREVCISYVLNNGYHRCKVVLDETAEDKKYAQMNMTLSEADILKEKRIAQIVASIEKPEDTERIANYINAHFKGYACGYRNINCVDITPYGVSKSTGLSYMVKKLQVLLKDVYAIGDSFNDIPMLDTFHGIAMQQAPMQVKSYTEMEVASVAECIQKLLTQNSNNKIDKQS